MAEFKQQQHPEVKPAKSATNQRTKKQTIPWVLLLVLCFTIFVGTRAFDVLAKKHAANKMNRAYINELESLATKEANLHTELNELATAEGVEQEIREKFRVTKEGEQIVVIVPQKKTANDTDGQSKGLFSFLRNLFK